MSGSSYPESWAAALDDIEARLIQAERFLDGEAVERQPYRKPLDLGPLPAEELPRAVALRKAMLDMDDRLAAVQTALSDSPPAA